MGGGREEGVRREDKKKENNDQGHDLQSASAKPLTLLATIGEP
jgi:hypothetical protein